ncbi:MAG TPA: hypothetical protein VHO90_02435 [Bacteroidales bacterium]|nr:hypothetical protein [Bacteroidales bacterium]
MKKEDTLINNMAKAVISLYEKFLSLWTGNVAVEESVNKLKAYTAGVDSAAYEQVNKEPKGLTTDKNTHRKLIIALTLGIIAKIRPYAKRINNNELLQAVDYSESELVQVTEELCINRCSTVAAKGREYLTKLTAYKLTESDLVALETALEPFDSMIEKRDVTRGERESATEKIGVLVPLIRQELHILDDLTKSQMPADFQTTYFNLR